MTVPPRSPAPYVRSTSLALLALLSAACDAASTWDPTPCDVALHVLKPSVALPGAAVIATGRPFTSAYDTAVYVGTERATILSLDREGCDDCDDCLDEHGCSGCDDCDDCDPLCSGCDESVTFEVPALGPGLAQVRLFNRHGESNPLTLDVLAPVVDTGSTDTGTGDSGPFDSSLDDTDGDDTSGGDTGPADSAPRETGAPDTAQR